MKKFYETEAEFLCASQENRRMARNLLYESRKLKYANAFVSTCSCNYAEALYDGAKAIGDLCDRLDAIVPELADKFWSLLEPSSSKEKKTKAGLWLVKSAEWSRIDYQRRGHDYVCSACGWKNDMATHFCPNCGADMREES